MTCVCIHCYVVKAVNINKSVMEFNQCVIKCLRPRKGIARGFINVDEKDD